MLPTRKLPARTIRKNIYDFVLISRQSYYVIYIYHICENCREWRQVAVGLWHNQDNLEMIAMNVISP